ncbi:MAG: helix-turn-helix domain-containing protein [Solirubrobacterales bacterium]
MRADTIGELVAKARASEGLTQAQLARRMGTTQSAVARLEAGQGNPTLATVEKALRACGHSLEPRARALPGSVDKTLIPSALKAAPAQRLAHHQASRRKMVEVARKARPLAQR